MKKSKPDSDPDFPQPISEKIHGLTDADLVNVLRKRAHYQPVAVSEAIREALLRGIIRTEEDLTDQKFEELQGKFTLFPFSDKMDVRAKLFSSITRSLMIPGVIPVAFGVLKFTLAKYAEGTGLISLGMIWIGIAWGLMEKRDNRFFWILSGLALLSLLYVIRIFSHFQIVNWIDLLVVLVLYSALLYLMLYARVLLKKLDTPA